MTVSLFPWIMPREGLIFRVGWYYHKCLQELQPTLFTLAGPGTGSGPHESQVMSSAVDTAPSVWESHTPSVKPPATITSSVTLGQVACSPMCKAGPVVLTLQSG